jgi:hypothetical protein
VANNSTITVRRGNDIWMDRNRRYKVMIDGQSVGQLRKNQSESFEVTSREHRVRIRIDFLKSNELTASLEEGQTLEFECRGHGSVVALFNTLFRWNKYLVLEAVSEK